MQIITQVLAWLQSQNVAATAVIAIGCYNIVMSAIQSLMNALKVQEPGWLQAAAAVGSKIASWLSANPPSVQVPAKKD